MDILKQLQRHAEQVEVVDLRSETTVVEFEANKLRMSAVEETQGQAVRVVKDGRLGFAASSDPTAGQRLVQNVLESAEGGDAISIRFPGPQPAPGVLCFDERIGSLPVARLVDIGRELVDTVLSVDSSALVNLSLQRAISETRIRNSSGADVEVRRSPLTIGVEISRVEGDDVLFLFDLLAVSAWPDDHVTFVRRLAGKLGAARQLTTLRPGRMPVVFAPSAAVALLLPIQIGLSGKNVYAGVSPLAGRIGAALFDPRLAVVDDATLNGAANSGPYDGEGVAHRRTVLIEEGVLQGFYYDLRTAAQAGAESTGNGLRSLFAPPEPAATHLVVEPGERSLEEMLAGIDQGLLVEDLLGVGQGNVISGAFSNPVALGWKIEEGQIAGRVKNVALAGNAYEVLRHVELSRERLWAFGDALLPWVLVPEMNVAGEA